MNNYNDIERTYYTLEDFFIDTMGRQTYHLLGSFPTLKDVLAELGDPQAVIEPEIEELWQEISTRYLNCYITYHDDVNDDYVFSNDCIEWIRIFLGWVRMTKSRYLTLLRLYKEQEDKLMAQVSATSTSSNRFNDTPQEAGNWDAQQYTSNINQAETTTAQDAGTTMSRLNEIRNSWYGVMDEWVRAGQNLFILA